MFSPVISLRTIEVTVPAGKMVTFISDVHLGYGSAQADRRREDLLLSVLDSCAETSSHVFIIGDLFDLWFDYKRVIPKGHVRTLAALHNLTARGIPVTYLMGNHDFGHYSYFRQELGITVDAGDVEVHINGTRLYLCHGDGKAHGDTGYLLLRALLRNQVAQWAYRWLHPDIGVWLASRTSHGSRYHTAVKDYGPYDGLRDFAFARIDEGYDLVVMGHRHKAGMEPHAGGYYINLGHWLDEGATYGVFSPDMGFQPVIVPPLGGAEPV